MKNPFLFVLLALFAALLVCSDVQAGCQQQVLALRQVQLQPVQVYWQVQQLNDGCYVQQQLQQVQYVQRVQQIRVQQLNDHHNNNGQQLLIIKQDNDGFFERLREARLQRLKNR